MSIKLQFRTPIPATPSTSSTSPLSVPMIEQEQTQWCWAGCADMVLHYYQNPGVQQYEFADWLFSQSSCVVAPFSSQCNRPCLLPDVSRVYDNWGLKSSFVDALVPYATLETEIAALRPVEVALLLGTTGHVALVVQAGFVGGQPWVGVHDPTYGVVVIPYDELVTAYGFGSWFSSWTGIRR